MKRNKFNLSHDKKMTMKLGYLTPLACFEILPGDIIRMNTAALIRMSPLLKPLMHRLNIRIHHWFVSYRNLWKEGDDGEKGFEDFITGGDDGNDDQVHPYVALGTVSEGDLWDYLGVPTGAHGGAVNANALMIRAYNEIYNHNYRDQDLVAEVDIDYGEGLDAVTEDSLLKCAWRKDAFTSARPWQQKGTNVTIPIGTSALVETDNVGGGNGLIRNNDGSLSGATALSSDGSGKLVNSGGATEKYYDPNGTMFADLSSVSGIDIEDLRTALGLQRFQERMAAYGSRYSEYLRGLGCILPDFRTTKPVYLGGGKQNISISEVLSTDGANTGDLKGHGIAAMRTNNFVRYFNEFGLIMTIASVVPEAVYMDSFHRMFSRETKYDYFQRELQLVGEQEVLNKEVQLSHSSPDGTFGYRPRYDSYRWLASMVHGDFRSTEDDWHMAREFAGDVALNQSFIECTPTDRIYASTATDPLKLQVRHNISALRPLIRHPRNKIM